VIAEISIRDCIENYPHHRPLSPVLQSSREVNHLCSSHKVDDLDGDVVNNVFGK
jgi:hypothetical protein